MSGRQDILNSASDTILYFETRMQFKILEILGAIKYE
jgi:hypothetical protein